MSGIVSSIGLASGLPIQDIIDQLMAVEARRQQIIIQRIEGIQSTRTALAEINARLLALRSTTGQFDLLSFFRRSIATSGNTSVLTASAAEGAVSGSYGFRVQSLVTRHQLISAGLPDADQTAVGRGTLSIEVGNGRLSRTTFLGDLNGDQGVGRGTIEIEDQAGHVAQIDLTSVLTMADVLNAINRESRIDVTATVSGDYVVITDTSGGSGVLAINDVGNGTIARDLGIAKSVDALTDGTVLRGDDINDVSALTSLGLLNDGNGIRRNGTGTDLVITLANSVAAPIEIELNDKMDLTTNLAMLNNGNGVDLGTITVRPSDGSEISIDLTELFDFGDGLGLRGIQTIQDLRDRINDAAGGAITLDLDINTNQLKVTDNTGGGGSFEIVDQVGTSAADLGLDVEATDGVIESAELYRVSTLGDVVRAINFAEGNYDLVTGERLIEAVISDNGIQLVRTDGLGDGFTVEAGEIGSIVSQAALDLGILGTSAGDVLDSSQLLAGLNTVLLRSLNGGSGVTLGTLTINSKSGATINVDLTAPLAGETSSLETVWDVIQKINEVAGSQGIRAELNAAGNGIRIVDETGGVGSLSVSDNLTAQSLGLVGSTSQTSLGGANLQLQYVSETTSVSDLNNGNGIGTGEFRITNRDGDIVSVNISENQTTVGDVIRIVNIAGESSGIEARINDTGDGIVIVDTTGGVGKLAISDRDGVVARNLRLLGEAVDDGGNQIIDGSYEFKIDVDADDTLDDVVAKINSSGAGISATVINDGSSSNPFRLSVSSGVTGTQGEMMFDTGESGLVMTTLVRPQDAVVFFGGSDSDNPIVLRSSTNTLTGVVQDVTINLLSTSDEVVDLTVNRDVEGIIEQVQRFVDSYNDVVDRIDELTFFNPDSLESGVLRNDPSMSRISSRLLSMISSPVPTGNRAISRFATIGINFENGGRLSFDEAEFREVFGRDPQAIEELFTLSEIKPELDSFGEPVIDPATGEPKEEIVGLGLGFRLDQILDELTRASDGLLARRDDTLERQQELFSDRVAQLQLLLDGKRARLELQFVNLEVTISRLQSQQSALTTLGALVFGR